MALAGSTLARADARQDRALAESKCAARDPDCDWLGTLSSLERQSVVRAIVARGYELDPEPWGKTIRSIRVYNEAVFSEKNRFLQFFNFFHVTTKDHALREEVIVKVGETWDPSRVAEVARRLRDPLWTSVVVVLPAKTNEPGKVDLLVITRDIWSLRLNTQYTYQQGSLTNLSIALSENNFLGRRVLFAAGFAMDQGAISTGPIFLDKNVLGKGIRLRVDARVILNRENLSESLGFSEGPPTISDSDQAGFTQEGTESSIEISRPLRSLSSKWGLESRFSHRYAIDRRFRGLGLLPVDCSTGECNIPTAVINGRNVVRPILDAARDTPDGTILGVQYEMRRWDVTAAAVRQWGTEWKQQLTVGHSVDRTNPRPLASFPGNADERAAFIRDVLPRNEVTSTPFISYGAFTPKFKTLRNIDTYELAEEVLLGPSFSVSYAVGLELLGSDTNFQRGSASASWSFPWCRDGFVRPGLSISTRLQRFDLDGSGDRKLEFIDNTASLSVRMATPTYKWARIVAETSVATRWNDTVSGNLGAFSIGSANGLRGFQIGEFRGQRLVRQQVELRSIPFPFWIVRLGGTLFYDLGGAFNTFGNDFALHHDVGFGLRMLVPQTARDLFRFDFAFPLDGAAAGKLRFIAAFEQAF